VSLLDALLARWAGESVNSLMPAGQIGGPMLMVRYLAQRGMRARDAAAVITVSTTMQTVAQLIFALIGVVLLTGYAAGGSSSTVTIAVLSVIGVIGLMIFGFYLAQRRGLFGRAMRFASGIAAKYSAKRDWSSLVTRAEAVDAAVHELYRERAKVASSFGLSFIGWIVGTGEVWLALHLLGHPVGWTEALLLESLGQAIRGAAFAIPGSLGVQEGGYLLLARLIGLPPEAALALSLAKRARELLLGVPGIVYLHFVEKGWQRRRLARVPDID
jgi:putative membrane protein